MPKSQGKPGLRSGYGGGPRPTDEDPTDTAMAALADTAGMVRTDLGFQQAVTVQKPRDLPKVLDKILYEAGQMGEDFIYSWRQKSKDSKEPDGKVTIEGMSIDGAMIMARNWGNCAALPELVQESQNHYLLKASFIDLESGYTVIRLFRQRKGGAAGDYADDRKEDIAFQIGQSKAIRNAIDKALPSWMRDRAIEAAKSNAASKYSPVEEHLPKVVAYAEGMGITQEALVARAGKPLAAWTPYDIVIVRSVFKAIAKRETTVAAEFPPVEAPPPQPTVVQTAAGEVTVPAEKPPVPTLFDAAGVALKFPEGVDPAAYSVEDLCDKLNAYAVSAQQPFEYEVQGSRGTIIRRDVKPASPAPKPKSAEELEAEEAERALAAKEKPAAATPVTFEPPKVG